MSMEHIRKRYGVPAKRGGRVRVTFDGVAPEFMKNTDMFRRYGTITSATDRVNVLLDGRKKTNVFHPLDLEYLEK